MCSQHGVPQGLRARVWSQLLLGIDRMPMSRSTALPAPDASGPDARVIAADARRTRVECVGAHSAPFVVRVESLLHAFCQRRGVRYQQGLHEVLAPLPLLLAGSESTGQDLDKEQEQEQCDAAVNARFRTVGRCRSIDGAIYARGRRRGH